MDDEDFDRVMKHEWHLYDAPNGMQYARTVIDGKFVLMQNFIMGIEEDRPCS